MTVEIDRSTFAGMTPSIEPPPPEEWDFRNVLPDALPTVLQYEYLRSCSSLRDVISQWHAAEFQGFSTRLLKDLKAQGISNELLRLGGVQFRDLLKLLMEHRLIEDPMICQEIESCAPELIREDFDLRRLAMFFDRFPTAWNRLPESYRAKRLNRRQTVSFGSCLFEIPPDAIPDPKDYAGQQICPYVLGVDWSSSDTRLLAKFGLWLKKRRPAKFSGKKHTGRANEEPFCWLRRLAALRWSERGYSYQSAQAHIRSYLAEHPGNYHGDVIPKYTSGAWSKAVKEARQMVERPDMFRRIVEECYPATHVDVLTRKR